MSFSLFQYSSRQYSFNIRTLNNNSLFLQSQDLHSTIVHPCHHPISHYQQLIVKREFSWQFWKQQPIVTTNPNDLILQSTSTDPLENKFNSVTIQPPIIDEPSIVADELGYIPEPPPIPSDIPIEFLLNAAGEPSLTTLGFTKWYFPTGWVQYGLEYLHADLNMPWYAAIMLGTFIIRLLTIPIAIYNQKNAANMAKTMPRIQELQQKLTDARVRGDQIAILKATYELMEHMKTSNMKPWRAMIGPFLQMPVFISFFLGIRGLANYPLESMMTGGALWFTDLTVADPFYILPIATAFTLFATLELGIETGMRTTNLGPLGRNLMRAVPFVTLFFTCKFASNLGLFISSGCHIILANIKYCNIDSSYNTEVEKRKQAGDDIFRRAGISSPVPTYKYDPTKVKTNNPPQIRKI
ncbi:unnamed protein product [Didymodactylos carnosus]|uniref:Membrane insertase YidC/Oxa/ALB C-terminal domain-containing protein n=1 Tax=Didymodactylos carnosus TaxID=1234261 RepID=A0A8S2CU75_9BILA|nr:unnamed protein product [Didymodactylos carnosus]CAF3587950.1 unnamed protein product [Didymodactylos carnosus]